MPRMEKMTLKAFWEAVEQRLAACSAEELRAILRTMAKETPPTERQAFLAKLSLAEGTAAAVVQQALQQEELLADIEDLAHELKAEMERADDLEMVDISEAGGQRLIEIGDQVIDG
ncbi:MAG: hypothetical protein ACE5JP_09335 [Candidatus Bipolaricaulia bacterium]